MTEFSRRRFLKYSSAFMATTAMSAVIPFRSARAASWDRLRASGTGKRVFITGSTSGIGLVAAEQLIQQGHRVVAHARNPQRARELKTALAGAEHIVIGDLSNMQQIKEMAKELNQLGHFDAVIQNAGTYASGSREAVAGNIPYIFMVNTLAPYMLTALMERPERIIFVSSSYHRGANIDITDITWNRRPWSGYQAYGCSKFYDALLANTLARYWPERFINTIRPGWVPTHMGGAGAPDDLEDGAFTQSWLAVSDEPAAHVSGKFFFHMQEERADPRLSDPQLQDQFIRACESLTQLQLPS
ncbi:SDR family NAD(P)-dependent oxidoreductase [Celerinatantimonas sp. YJH-8]|uniref:SDR family NAD(P)-dependent oxidoreductase n=1 Tax=Celerinatantimonas sp. YJH-8 TaxID=3228714 RepID=UPI0038CAC608